MARRCCSGDGGGTSGNISLSSAGGAITIVKKSSVKNDMTCPWVYDVMDRPRP